MRVGCVIPLRASADKFRSGEARDDLHRVFIGSFGNNRRSAKKSYKPHMQRATAYATLAAELESWRALSLANLLAVVNQPAAEHVVQIDGQDLLVEISVSWATEKRKAFKVLGIAYGPSHLMTERLQEVLIVPIEA